MSLSALPMSEDQEPRGQALSRCHHNDLAILMILYCASAPRVTLDSFLGSAVRLSQIMPYSVLDVPRVSRDEGSPRTGRVQENSMESPPRGQQECGLTRQLDVDLVDVQRPPDGVQAGPCGPGDIVGVAGVDARQADRPVVGQHRRSGRWLDSSVSR